MRILTAALATLVVVSGGDALGQKRREGDTETKALRVELPRAVAFGEIKVAPGKYLIGLSDAGLALIIEDNMFTTATVPVQRHEVAAAVKEPSVRVITRQKILEIRIAIRNTRLVARGTVLTNAVNPRSVGYEHKDDPDLERHLVDRPSDITLLAASIERYIGSVKHCGESAVRHRFTSDDPRFARCLCPIVAKWRLPKLKLPLRAHRVLVPERVGMSFSVATDGHPYDCRVWVGATSTELPEDAPAPAPVTIVPATADEALPELAPIEFDDAPPSR